TDTLLTANFALSFDQRNDLLFPTNGSRFQLAIDQSIPVGNASIFYTRPMANFTQFIPMSFIQVRDTPSTLIFNIQGGSLLGDVPPYEAFVLGGSSSVRGYGAGEVASSQTFLQTSAEYRVPFASVRWGRGFFQNLLGEEMLFAGSVFFDYATGFGTQTFVTGEPGVVREKPGDGFGYGIGLLTTSELGLVRLELGINDAGDIAVYFNIGDRF
ncbi:MAG TPA: BamA/TamA family outer membrane protein, partial [Allocoleopsis sp.]